MVIDYFCEMIPQVSNFTFQADIIIQLNTKWCMTYIEDWQSISFAYYTEDNGWHSYGTHHYTCFLQGNEVSLPRSESARYHKSHNLLELLLRYCGV